VLGIDGASRAIEKARRKAAERGVAARFEVVDALDLSNIGRTFDTVIDVGLFHSFDDEQRLLWTKSLATVLAPGGRYFVVTFSDKVQFGGGPRRIRREEFADTFKVGFRVISVDESHLDSNRAMSEVPAWLATIERTGQEAPPSS
jgi:2-polyprenyl-3-methyl-5-hydroxy-6-metoxy-1,4-benzoquinol methylase